MSLITENDLDTVRNALRRCKEFTLERTLAERKVRLSVVTASPVWHVAMLVRVERWWPGWYASKYCASVEEARKYIEQSERPVVGVHEANLVPLPEVCAV